MQLSYASGGGDMPAKRAACGERSSTLSIMRTRQWYQIIV